LIEIIFTLDVIQYYVDYFYLYIDLMELMLYLESHLICIEVHVGVGVKGVDWGEGEIEC